jgi:hypothetical protein
MEGQNPGQELAEPLFESGRVVRPGEGVDPCRKLIAECGAGGLFIVWGLADFDGRNGEESAFQGRPIECFPSCSCVRRSGILVEALDHKPIDVA